MSINLVSVVIPSYNHAQYIEKAIESVLGQSYKNLELIVVDDGSSDESLDYLRSVDDARYKLVEQKNSGAHNAINKGLALTNGDYIAILNSDDVFHIERLSVCVELLKDGVDLVSSWIEVINQKGKVLGIKEGWRNMLPWTIQRPIRSVSGIDDFALNLLMTNFVSTTSNIVFSRRLYEKIGGMRNLRFVHDWDFLLRAARYFKCRLIERPLLQYRTHQANTISSDRAWMLFEICWIFAVHLKYFIGDLYPYLSYAENISEQNNFLVQSINVQGNDKVLRMLLQYFDVRKELGEMSPYESVIDQEHLRNAFVRHIKC